jgi:hypothetical protein
MKREEMLRQRFVICNTIEYNIFIEEATEANLVWMDGSKMDSYTTTFFREKSYPFVVEVDEFGQIAFDTHTNNSTELSSYINKNKKQEMNLLVNQKNPGITVTLNDGREFVYDIKDALENNYAFHSWLKSVTKPPIQVGDIVRITDCGQLYTTYLSWFKENKVDIDIAARYAYANEVNPPMSVDYEVLAVGQHVNNGATLYAIAQKSEVIYGGNPVYLIGGRGIREV